MSSNPTPGSTGTTGPTSTRQLLDELDALMQRMLALPVNQPEAERATASTPASPLVLDPDTPPPSSTLAPPIPQPPIRRLSRPVEPGPLPPPAQPPLVRLRPVVPTPDVDYSDSSGGVLPATREEADGEPPVEDRETETIRLPEALGPTILQTLRADIPVSQVPPKTTTAVPRPRTGLPWWLRPLAWINRTFDSCTRWLGPAGLWLRGPVGKNLLGWAGVLMLLGALSWQIMLWSGWL